MLALYLSALEDDRDRSLFAALYEEYEKKLYFVAREILQDQALAEDAVHDTFLKVIRHFEDYKQLPKEKRACWLAVIAKNTALDIRRKRRWETAEYPIEEALVAVESRDDSGDYLVELIRALPESYRSTLELKYLLEWTDAESAKLLGISEAALRQRLSRGRKLLKQRLEEVSAK